MTGSMEEQLEILNEYQLAAVKNEDPVCLVNANVGSGKTRVLVTKAAYLHEACGIAYEHMMILTFTNKAADELKERLALSSEEMPLLGTFHHVAMVLLKEYLDVSATGFTEAFELLLPEEELALAEELIKTEKLKIKYKNRLAKRLENEKKPKYNDDLPKLRVRLAEEKLRLNVMSYEDLLRYTIRLVQEDRWIRDMNLAYILVDEVQDCDEMQLMFLDVFMEKFHPHLFAVGDPSQSIYSFRAGHIQVFYRLRTRYNATELNLPINYRSNPAILEAARFFKQGGSDLIGMKEEKNLITVKKHYDAVAEGEYLADRVSDLHAQGIPWEEIAIFYRLKGMESSIEKVFEREHIPIHREAEEIELAQPADEDGTAEAAVSENFTSENFASENSDSEHLIFEGVHLMTLHASKGLEFDCVFIIGVNDGILPVSLGFDAQEEERRLFYVGITRARKYLELSCYENPSRPGARPGIGMFLQSVPPSLIAEQQLFKPAVSLQELKRMVESEKKNKRVDQESGDVFWEEEKLSSKKGEDQESSREKEADTKLRRVSHPKYGEGEVTAEDDMMITVNFDSYGEKSFMKMLSELTDL